MMLGLLHAVAAAAEALMMFCVKCKMIQSLLTTSWLSHSGDAVYGSQVDCSSLPEGLHYAEISAKDSTAPWRGALFRIPVTVIKPAMTGQSSAKDRSSTDTGDHNQLVGFHAACSDPLHPISDHRLAELEMRV